MATIAANTFCFKPCFSTGVCPEWTAAAIVDGMMTYGFEGVEICIGQGHLHGVDVDTPKEGLQEVRKQFDDANLAVACISTPIHFSSVAAAERKESIEELKQTLRMAEFLGCPYVRVFGGEVPAECEVAAVVDWTAESLAEISDFIETSRIRSRVLLQTHDTFSHSKYINEVMSQVCSDRIGVLWDIVHPLRVLEKVEDTYDAICDYVRHIHLHDYEYSDDRTEIFPCNMGDGILPMDRVIDVLKAAAYRGYLSIDAEGLEVDPDEMLPEYAKFLKQLTLAEPVNA